jgi:predicted Zn-dependent protease
MLACQQKHLSDAKRMIDEAITIAGTRPTLLDTQALVLLEAGKPKEAIRLLEELVKETSKVSGYYYHLALAHLADRDRNAATRSLRLARQAGFKESPLHPLERPAYEQLVRSLASASPGIQATRRGNP